MTAKPPHAIDRKQIRRGAFAISGIALVGALGVAMMTGDPKPAPTQEAPSVAGPAPASPPVVAAPDTETPPAPVEPLFETASADAAPPLTDISFVVRFGEAHELGRAQTLAEQGRTAEARRRAEAALRNRADLRGLCFDRFTAGGAEIVLRLCQAPTAQNANQVRQSWILRLRGMPGVDYADANLSAQPDAARPQ